jgi:hypothetical protein
MNHFITFKNINKNTEQINKLIKTNCKIFKIGEIEYNLYTYTLKLPKNKFEDEIYGENPDLLKYLPRACSILVKNNQIIDCIEGPEKFSGKSDIDEDPEDNNDEVIAKSTGIYDHNKIITWAKSKCLEITETEKANGKFAICKIIFDHEQKLLLVGSKNNHFVLAYEQIEETIELENSNDIIVGILTDIKKNWNNLNSEKIIELFSTGYSLAGELCDGQHFTPGDNTISWFGFFKSGQSLDTIKSLGLLNSIGLKTVKYGKVFDNSMDVQNLDSVYLASRCKNTEGSVLRCSNIKTGETILVKTKSVKYIVKRFMRQVILRGYKEIEKIKTRFIQAQKYHGLGTSACIRVTNQLIKFAFWMIDKKYPCAVLGFTKVVSVKRQLPNGFNNYWTEWIESTGNPDIVISLEDFCHFSELEYLAGTELYNIRPLSEPAIVVFFQGLQGSGKSTVGAEICIQLAKSGISAQYIEQDDYWGDTLACQGALHHAIASELGPKVILVTRCNSNITQYKRYIDIAQKLPSIITFVSPNNFGPLYLMISLAGIVNRSNLGDKLMVGRFEYEFSEVIEFTVKNFNEFEIVSNAKRFDMFNNDNELEKDAIQAIKSNHLIEKFVKTNCENLNQLRHPVNVISSQLLVHITNLLDRQISNVITNPNPIYIGLAVNPIDKLALNNFVNLYFSGPGTTYNHHCTLEFYGGKKKVDIEPDTILPGQIVSAQINELVIRKSDNACAFKINKLIFANKEIKLKHQAHITAKIPSNEKPGCSGSFVGLVDDKVSIISFNKTLSLTCFWS